MPGMTYCDIKIKIFEFKTMHELKAINVNCCAKNLDILDETKEKLLLCDFQEK